MKENDVSFWVRVGVGGITTIAVVLVASLIFNAVMDYREASVGYGATPATIQEAWEAAAVQIIMALAAIGTGIIVSFKELVVDKIQAWWTSRGDKK